jgi:hypothetical protein
MRTPLQPGDIDFAFTDKLNRQARRRKLLWSVADIVAPAIIILTAMAVGWILCATWTSN